MENVKQDILGFMAESNVDVGEAFPAKPFYSMRMNSYTPPERDAVPDVLESLVSEGVLVQSRNGYTLTQVGFDRIYPEDHASAVEFVKEDILDFLRSNKARSGDSLPIRPFFSNRAMHYNPKRKNALEPALAELVSSGVLNENGQSYSLTEAGYRNLY